MKNEENYVAVILQLRQSAAYDLISHEILKDKLNKDLISWFISNLSQRKTTVEVEVSDQNLT